MIPYDVKDYQISGPGWLDTERYDILVKVPAGATKEQVYVMWQSLLAERFGLMLHHAPKEFQVEELVIGREFWAGKRVLVTGHTGFKGSWLALWLSSMGARVSGYALQPTTTPSLWQSVEGHAGIASTIADVRDPAALLRAFEAFRPELVFHLAAQSLVHASYGDPVGTYATNVMGTVHLLQALRTQTALKAVLAVTSDKVYANAETGRAFAEDDPLGGKDPYSASKAATEIAVQSFAKSYFEPAGVPLATARGGNVIGGGDFSPDRIVADIVRAARAQQPFVLRHPEATRPWQHVLDCLAGYLVLIIAGLFLPILAVIGYLAIALYYIIPSRRLSAGFLPRRRRSPRP